MKLPIKDLANYLLRRAEREAPREMGGVILGTPPILTIVEIRNRSWLWYVPEFYWPRPEEVWATFHSHPFGRSYPSQMDKSTMARTGHKLLIVCLMPRTVRCFVQDDITQLTVTIREVEVPL